MQRALYALVGLFVLIVAGGLALPRFARVEVGIVVDSPPSVVFAQANDFRRLALWAPPQSDDPDARVSYAGPTRGEGARVEWNGPISGGGAQVIVESIPFEYVSYLVNPGEAAQAAAWVAIERSAGGETRVVRGFEHDYGYNLVGRYFGAMWSGMIRRDYRLSLDRLQALLDSLPTVDYGDLELSESYVEATNIAYVVITVPGNSVPDAATLDGALDQVRAYLERNNLEANGPAMAILRGAIGARRRLDAAIPFAGARPAEAPSAHVMLGRAYEGHVISATLHGRREQVAAAHDKLAACIAATGRRLNGDPWEIYVTGSGPPDLRIEVHYPVLGY